MTPRDLRDPETLTKAPSERIFMLIPLTPQALDTINLEHNDRYKHRITDYLRRRDVGICITRDMTTKDSLLIASFGRDPTQATIQTSDSDLDISRLHFEIVLHEASKLLMLRDLSMHKEMVVRQEIGAGANCHIVDLKQNGDHSVVLLPNAAIHINLTGILKPLSFQLRWGPQYRKAYQEHSKLVAGLREQSLERNIHERLPEMMSPSGEPLRWETLRKLGAGTSGVVMLCVNVDNGALVAMKKILADRRAIVEHEVNILEKLDHEHILKVLTYDFGPSSFRIYTVAYQASLNGLINSQIEPKTFRKPLFQQLLAALYYTAGKGIAHLDLKPGNILFSYNKQRRKYHFVISDWGLAAQLSSEGNAMEPVAGTPQFEAPELNSHTSPVYAKTADMWSLCVTMLCALDKEFYRKLTREIPESGSEYERAVTEEASKDRYLTQLARVDPKRRASPYLILRQMLADGSLLPEIKELLPFAQTTEVQATPPRKRPRLTQE